MAIWRLILRPVWRAPDFIIGAGRGEVPYLLRWYIIPRNRFFNIYLHKFLRDDDDRALHDHPWHSLSIGLKGRYKEIMPGRWVMRRPGVPVFRRATHQHRIVLLTDWKTLADRPVWTLFITGPKVRDWGFWCPQGFIPWQRFVDQKDHGAVGRGCDQ